MKFIIVLMSLISSAVSLASDGLSGNWVAVDCREPSGRVGRLPHEISIHQAPVPLVIRAKGDLANLKAIKIQSEIDDDRDGLILKDFNSGGKLTKKKVVSGYPIPTGKKTIYTLEQSVTKNGKAEMSVFDCAEDSRCSNPKVISHTIISANTDGSLNLYRSHGYIEYASTCKLVRR